LVGRGNGFKIERFSRRHSDSEGENARGNGESILREPKHKMKRSKGLRSKDQRDKRRMKGDRISKTGELETPNLVVYRRRVKTYQISRGRVAIKYEIETRGEPIRLMDGLERLYVWLQG